MGKILSKSGDSLADVYDVEGSIAGIDNLESANVNLVHEMGATIFSERAGGRIISIETGAIVQSVNFNQEFDVSVDVPGFSRVLGVTVISNDPSRVEQAQVSITSPTGPTTSAETDLPIWAWDEGEPNIGVSILVNGATFTSSKLLVPAQPFAIPNLMLGNDSRAPINLLNFRGRSTGFGAGTVTVTALIYMVFAEPGALSNRGLPLPSW